LGAGPTDAEEIKQHPWFKGVNWNSVYNRKMNPIKPIANKINTCAFSTPLATPGVAEPTKNRIAGWSFIKFNK
jgi:hypothetical protein